jgi:ATP-dependent DNA helicase RecQ
MADIYQILKKYWGYDTFRPLQEDIIHAVLNGKDTLALLPTSAGKSICFQVPALAMEGICIVVTPLIALMKNQVENLRKRGINAVAIFSGMHRAEMDTLLDNCIYGEVKFLYVSPERLGAEIFIERVKKMKVNLLAIDEAHCISQWGYDFRPPYLKIADFRQIIPQAKLIALTASATIEVKQDIIDKLNYKNIAEFRQSFARKNISYSVFDTEDKDKKTLDILGKVPGSSIIYVRSRKKAKSTADWLKSKGFNADFYHAGLSNEQRNQKQDAWIRGKTTTIVATNAFGMGIDKADVRLVLHTDLPESLEAYYQEAGRGGRDEQKAFAVVLFNQLDTEILIEKIETAYPEIEFLRRIYQMLANYFHIPVGSGNTETYPFDIAAFQKNFDIANSTMLYNGLKLLENEGFIILNEAFYNPSKVQIVVSNAQLYDFRIRNENLDSFLKTLLRIYGGELFTDFQKIDEQQIAKVFLIKVEEVIKYLNILNDQQIIMYQKQTNLPQITYLTPRYDAKLLPINAQQIALRKNRDLEKSKAMINYVLNMKHCRSKIIQEYFNENTISGCGICDICLTKNKEKTTQTPLIEAYKKQILACVPHGEISINQLKNTLMPAKEKYFLEAVQILLEDGNIVFDSVGNLKMK